MSNFISLKITPKEYKHFKVEREVYNYIKQLEAYINNPEESMLKKIYPDRFHEEIE
jgi:hypothetical protein